MKVALKDITQDLSLNIRQRVDRETVRHYAEILDELPPGVVFDTPEGKLLADGFHRADAARLLGREHMNAAVKRGTRGDALLFAAEANAKHARPLSRRERYEAATRFIELTKLNNTEIADRLGMSSEAVGDTRKHLRVRAAIDIPKGLDDSHLTEIVKLPKSDWQAFADAAAKRRWTVYESRVAAKVVRDKRTPATHRKAILAGKTDPIYFTENGQAAVNVDSLGRALKNARERDVYAQALTVLGHVFTLRQRFTDGGQASLDDVQREDLDRLVTDLDSAIDVLTHLRDLADGRRGRLEVVA